MINIHLEEGYYGMKENGITTVPFVHLTKESAIEEWEYHERLNTDESQFLDHKRTNEEITEIVNRLKKQIKL